MKLELSFSHYCSTENFRINNIEAEYEDFVDKYDHSPWGAPNYGCGDMKCDIKNPIQEVLDKYNINEQDFYEIAEALNEGLSLGCCGWCI